jgi:hypothetical protein
MEKVIDQDGNITVELNQHDILHAVADYIEKHYKFYGKSRVRISSFFTPTPHGQQANFKATVFFEAKNPEDVVEIRDETPRGRREIQAISFGKKFPDFLYEEDKDG